MEEKIKWDFRALDKEDNGRISLESALFLFKAVHGDKFSQRYWNLFADSRLDPYEDVYFDEIKLFLCNIPEYASSNGDQEYFQQQQVVRENAKKLLEEEHQILENIQVGLSSSVLKSVSKKCAVLLAFMWKQGLRN